MNWVTWNIAERKAAAQREIDMVLAKYGLVQDVTVDEDRAVSQRRLSYTIEPIIFLDANPQWQPPMDDDNKVSNDFVEALTGQRREPQALEKRPPVPDDGTPAPEVLPFPQEASA